SNSKAGEAPSAGGFGAEGSAQHACRWNNSAPLHAWPVSLSCLPSSPIDGYGVFLLQFSPQAQDFGDQQIQVAEARPVIADGGTKAMFAPQRRIGKHCSTRLLQPQHDLGVQRLDGRFVKASWVVSETDDVDGCRRHQG